jgi:repressor LexA
MRKVKSPSTRERIFDFIRDFLAAKGYAPTVRDIVRGCNISTTSVVQHHLDKLEKEGYIQRDPQVFRSIRLVEPEAVNIEVPLLGTIAAGEPIPVPTADAWSTETQEMLKVPADMFPAKTSVYALKVKGTSMIDALINDGDIVLMEPVTTVNNGDMVAVWLQDRQEVTLKRLYREKTRVRLQPANPTMAPFYEPPENVAVQGRVVGVIRKLS